jgi:hypothetical protein
LRRYRTVATPARFSDPLALCLTLATLVTSLAGCGRGDEVSMLAIARLSESRQYGWLYKGSLWRGTHDGFQWLSDEGQRARMRMLQDDVEHKISTEPCEPDAGFHYCVLVHGDPQGAVRYQSRRMWGLTRPKLPQGFDLAEAVEALADADPELAALRAAAEAP